MLDVQQLYGGYAGFPVLEDISFQLGKGELLGILGPNGSGKTTLLKIVSGILPLESGEILLKGKALHDYTRKDLAKIIAVLPQHANESFSYTVKETVSLGRYAHQKGWFHSWSTEDETTVQRVMEQTGISHFENYYIQELSGGERQRVFLAQALAQEPEILLLDEPTNHLDLSYQKELLDLLRRWTKECGLSVISIFHDLNLASLYCDRLLLLEKGKMNINDTPNEVLSEERIRSVYQTDIEKQPHSKVPAPQMLLLPEKLSGENEHLKIDASLLECFDDYIALKSPIPLRTMSSGVTGAGTGWHQSFVNRHVHKDYNFSDHRAEMAQFLQANGFEPRETVGMMTAVILDDVCWKEYETDGFSVFIVITAGVGNAVDISKSDKHVVDQVPGTINTWVFINAELTEEAFIQSIMTATEAKAKALADLSITDPVTGTVATGTSTDSILIAAIQKGPINEYAGPVTPLGKAIGKGVYECTKEAILNSRKRKKTC